jgi:hypothetical protein
MEIGFLMCPADLVAREERLALAVLEAIRGNPVQLQVISGLAAIVKDQVRYQ